MANPPNAAGRLQQIAARYGAASTSPWSWGDEGLEHSGQMQYLVLALPFAHLTQSRGADLDLIENAPADISYLLNLVAQLEVDLRRAEQEGAEIRQAVTMPQPLRQFEQQADVQPVLDRAARLEAALEVVAAREVLNAAARDHVLVLVTLAHDAWGLIANAEDFKHELVDGQSVPIGDEQWRQAATAWRDRFHRLAVAHGPVRISADDQPTNHDRCGERYNELLSQFNRLADELERVRDAYRHQEASHETERARWVPQIGELTTERDAANRQLVACRHAQAELERELDATRRAKQENDERFQLRIGELDEELNVLRSSDALEAVAAHAGLRDLAGRFEVDGGGMHATARVSLADLNAWKIVVGDQDTKRSTKRVATAVAQPPTQEVGVRGCRGYTQADEDYFIYCDQEWPHLPMADPDSDTGDLYDHCNLTWGKYFNQQRGELPPQAPWQGPGWTLGHVRQFVAAYPDWSDDAPINLVVPERPRAWAHDGSGLYSPPFLVLLTVDDPRDFL